MNAKLTLICLTAFATLAPAFSTGRAESVTIITDRSLDRAARHGLVKLEQALIARRISVDRTTDSLHLAGAADYIVVAGLAKGSGRAARFFETSGFDRPTKPESLVIQRTDVLGKKAILVAGADDRGLMYALLDVADRVGWAADAADPFAKVRNASESPHVSERAVSIYTMQRAHFESRLHDEKQWARYFDMLAENRFNTFVLVFGYENAGYMTPVYPWFFDVEGYPDIQVIGLRKDEQERNLRALNRMIELAHDRGLDVSLGLWDHIYRGGVQSGGMRDADPNKPGAGRVVGLSATNLMAYSKVALAKFLREVPNADALQFRMHDESGLKPGQEQHEFWKTIFQIVKGARPQLPLTLRAKGLPDAIIDLGLDMGLNVRVATKYWAEQMGLPFHPTHIPRQNQLDRRHGYADLLRYPKRYDMHWRLWNGGTTRILLWGDPGYVRRFAGSTHMYDGDGFEVNEMLATKMASQPHDERPFDLLNAAHRYYDFEFERYWHFYQVFGRVSYNPDTPSEIWDEEFERRFGGGAGPLVRQALHRASWILPMINAAAFPYNKFPTTRGWAEKQRWDSLPSYSKAEGSDTEQFLSFDEAARDLVDGTESAKRHPERSSRWFNETADTVLDRVRRAEQTIGARRSTEFGSTIVDLKILANLARYHARRLHAGLSYALFRRSLDVHALDDAIRHERQAIEAWEGIVAAAGNVYADDLTMGLRSSDLSGHWRDELVSLKGGLAELERQSESFEPSTKALRIAHVPVRKLAPGADFIVRATVAAPDQVKAVQLAWRGASGEFKRTELQRSEGHRFATTIRSAELGQTVDYFIEAESSAGVRITFPAEGSARPIKLVVSSDNDAPRVRHVPIVTASAAKPMTITAQVDDASGVKWVRVRYRGVTQFQDYWTLEMRRAGTGDRFEAVIPAEHVVPEWDFMYFIEAMDQAGNGCIHPDLDKETPYVVVKLERGK